MKKMLAAAAILAAIIAVGGWFSPKTGLNASGGGLSGPSYGMIYGGTEGDNPLIYASSTLPFIHRVQLRYRYMPGPYALHAGQDTIPLTAVSHSYGDSALSVVKEITLYDTGLYDGDSLYVNVTVAAEDSTVLSTHEIAYLIDHDIVTLAMGNPFTQPHGGTLFNPTGLVPTQTVTCDSNTFRAAFIVKSTGAAQDSGFVTTLPNISFLTTTPFYIPPASVLSAQFWWDLSNIPDDVTIVEAKLSLRINYANDLAIGAGEGFYATLDTLSSDARWLNAPVSPFACRYSNTSWNRPRRAIDSPWSPLLSQRQRAHEWGIQSGICRDVTGDPAVLATGDAVAIDVKEVLQYWVDYHDVRGIRNAGFNIQGFRAAGGSCDLSLGITTPNNRNGAPSLIVRYQNKKNTDYDWNGYPFVFVYSTDDGSDDNVDFYKPVFDSHGLKYTAFIHGAAPDAAGAMTSAEIKQMHDEGYEIGNHQLRHRNMNTVPVDSIGYFLNRQWLANILELSGSDTMQINTFAYTYGDTADSESGSPSAVIGRLLAYDYIGARMAWNVHMSAVSGLLYDSPGDVYKVGSWRWDAIADNNDIVPDSIRVKMIDIIGYSSYRGGPDGGEPIVTLSHGTVDGSGYDEMNPIPLGLLLDELQRRGDVWVTTFGQMMALYRQNHVSVGGRIWTLP